MGRDRRQSPRLEALEGKQLLSAARFDHIVASAAPLVMNGTLKGVVSSFTDLAGPPETMMEMFTGRTRSMGRVTAIVTDQIDTAGHLLGGTVVLANARGSVTLGFGPGSTISSQEVGTITDQVVRYSVVSGTGAYARASGAGTFTALQNSGTYAAATSTPASSTLVLETTTS